MSVADCMTIGKVRLRQRVALPRPDAIVSVLLASPHGGSYSQYGPSCKTISSAMLTRSYLVLARYAQKYYKLLGIGLAPFRPW